MKKLSFIMALMLVITAFTGLFAVPTSAATYAEDTVAVVNGLEVSADELLDVLVMSPAGGTVEIVKDFTTFSLLFTAFEGITSAKWVINGNGKTITSPITQLSNTNYLITVSAVSVEINNLTLKTMANGINVKDGSQITLNNVNVYAGGTKAGLTVEAADRDFYIADKGSATVCSYAVNVSNTTRSCVTINGGVYKAYGVNGVVLRVQGGNTVVNDGYFVGEDCSFVARVYNGTMKADMSTSTTSLTIYDGTFIKPVINRKAWQQEYKVVDGVNTPNGMTDTNGSVLRADAGGIINIHGGDFISFTGMAYNSTGGTGNCSKRDYLILGGISTNSPSCVGFINIFDGNFYGFMSTGLTSGAELIGNYSGSKSEVNEAAVLKINTNIYGGNFYSNAPSREVTIKSAVNKAAKTIQHVPTNQYSATETANQSVTVYGQTFTGVTKWSFSYNEPASAPSGATVKVANSNGKTYYVSDYSYNSSSYSVNVKVPALMQAINGIADKNATVTLLSNLAITPTEVLNRGNTLTIDGNNKTLTAAAGGLTVSSGNITIKDITINADVNTSTSYAIKIAKTAVDAENTLVDTFKLNLRLENCILAGAQPVIDNPFLEGSVTALGCTVNTMTLNLSHTYTAPEPQLPDLDFEGGDDSGAVDTPPVSNTPDANNNAAAPAETTGAANVAKKGCKNSIGIGAVAIIAVAGAACGLVSKKRED